MLRCGSKNGHQKHICLRDWSTWSNVGDKVPKKPLRWCFLYSIFETCMSMFCSIYYCNPWRVLMTRHYVTEKHILNRPAQYDRLTVQRKTYESPFKSLSLIASHDMWYFLQCLRDTLETSRILEFFTLGLRATSHTSSKKVSKGCPNTPPKSCVTDPQV